MENDKKKEIRIANVQHKTYLRIKELASLNKRTIAKQAEFMLEWFINNKKE